MISNREKAASIMMNREKSNMTMTDKSSKTNSTDFTILAPRDRRYSSLSELSFLSFSELDTAEDTTDDALRTIIQYRFHSLSGRDAEVAHLREAYDRASKGPSEVVFLQGVSGSGKTAIVDHALRTYASSRGGYFCYGKFDQGMTHMPFSATVQAYTDLIDLIASHKPQTGEMKAIVTKNINHEDIKVMARLVSNLPYLIGAQGESKLFDDTLDASGTSVVRLKLIFSAFLRALSSREHPVVLVLDDIQWSDQASQDVIKALITDTISRNVLIVCMYRRGEFGTATEFDEIQKGNVLKISELFIENLGLNEMNEMLVDLTKMDARVCLALSKVVLSKTDGNPYHAMHFLELLARSRRLNYDEGSTEWSWDIGRIMAETNVSDNVVTLLERKIKHLPKALQLILEVAAYLGFSFEFNVLETVMFELGKSDSIGTPLEESSLAAKEMREMTKETVLKRVESAVTEGLIEPTNVGVQQFKFRHARIQEAARALVPPGPNRESLHARIGGFLYKMSRQFKDQMLLMQAVDHLNLGSRYLRTSRQKVKLANLNLESSKAAVSKAALSMARDYLKSGIKLLEGENMWSNPNNYQLALDLHSALAELGECTKDSGRSSAAVDAILQHAHSELDKMRAHHATMERLLSFSQFADVLRTGREVLRKLGYRFPKKESTAAVVFEFIRVKGTLRGLSDEKILALRVVEEDTIKHTMRVLGCMGQASYFSGGQFKNTFVLAILRMVKLTCKKGLTESSILGFAWYGCLLSLLGKADPANRFGNLSIKLARRVPSKGMEARCESALYHLVFPWKRQLKECIEGFRVSYQLGMASGDTHSAFSSGMGAISLMHHTGTPLWETEERLQLLVVQMREFRQDEICRNSLPFYQVVLNLKYTCDSPSLLKGDAMDITVELETPSGSLDDHAFRMQCAAQVPLTYYFEDWDRLETLLPLFDGKHQPIQAHFSNFLSNFSAGMAYFELFRRTQKREYLKSANKKLKRMKKWLDGGNVNCLPLVSIMEADKQAMSAAAFAEGVLVLYEKGAMEASALSFIQIEAIAYERAATVSKDWQKPVERNAYLSKCITLYHDWGADAKVDFLLNKHEVRLRDMIKKKRSSSSSSLASLASNGLGEDTAEAVRDQ